MRATVRRREFISLLGGAAAWVSPACAQELRRVIGVLCSLGPADVFADIIMPALVQGLKDVGFVEGRNISIEIRWADGHYDRLPSLAAELVGRNAAAIYATDVPSAFAAKAATKTISLSSQRASIRSRWGSSIVSVDPRIILLVSAFFSVFWDQSTWSCCMSFSLPQTQSHSS